MFGFKVNYIANHVNVNEKREKGKWERWEPWARNYFTSKYLGVLLRFYQVYLTIRYI